MRRLHVQLMAVTSLVLALAVGISVAALYLIGWSSATAATRTALMRGLHLAGGTAAAPEPGLRAPAVEAWRAGTGGTLEVLDGRGDILWRVGPPIPSGAALAAERSPAGAATAGSPGRLLAALRIRPAPLPSAVFLVGEAPVRRPPFPSTQELGVIFGGIAALAAAQVLWALLSRRLSSRLRALAQLVRGYARGDFRVRPDVRSPLELAQLAEAMAEMADALGRERAARETFLAEVAHDLRTPLTALRTTLVGLRDAEAAARDPALVGRLDQAGRETERLARLVNDLLDLARYEAGHLAIPARRVDLREAAALAAATAEGAAAARRLVLRVELAGEAVWVWGDLDRAAQVLLNLVDNAVRYTPEGGSVEVVVRREGDGGVARVEDTGPGFPPGAAEWAWSAFARGKTARENDGGTGLGLAVGRALARAMGGDLRILLPDPGRGGRVELRLRPAADGTGPADGRPAPAGPG